MKWWKVTFATDGKVTGCVEVDPSQGCRIDNVVLIQAASLAEAKNAAYNLYCARKKRARIAQYHTQERCACGRKQDRFDPVTGERLKVCSVCAARRGARRERAASGDHPMGAPRDEKAKAEACRYRVRDRKNEIRLEVLLEVKKVWTEYKTVGAFAKWLNDQIEEALKPRTPVE